ncbi:MAG: 50S ribosomal protein L15 [Candidatus Sumerlaeia bacterium]
MKLKIHDLPGDPGRQQKRKRIGRGRATGQGTQAGKGHKGQKARAGFTNKGANFEGGQNPLVRRLPKFGFTNPFKIQYAVVNVSALDVFEDGAEVTPAALFEKRLVGKRTQPVKILGDGELSKKLVVKAHKFSRSAVAKIQARGGSAEVIRS